MNNQMNGLYPIIRRVRRPLVPLQRDPGGADAKPAGPARRPGAPVEEAAALVPLVPEASVEPDKKKGRKEKRGNGAGK